MSFPRYTAYKDSGVPWLGDVPAHWDVLSLKRLFTTVGDRATERRFPIALENIEGWTGRRVENEEKGEFDGDGVAFQDGDILYGKLRPYLAKTWLADRAGEAVGDFHVLRTAQRLEPAFYRDLLLTPSIVSVLNGSTQGAKMPRVSWDFMGMMKVVQPPLPEQRAISAFVEREAIKLDSLVAEQEALLGLLEEKRAAVIAQVVTNGLDPDIPMRASGVEGLGLVPAHWDAVRLSVRCDFLTGKAHEPFFSEGGQFLCVTARFVSTQGDQSKRCTENLAPALQNDILMVMSDLPNGRALAKAYYVSNDKYLAVNQRVCIIRARQDSARFLYYQLDRHKGLLANNDGMNQTHLSNDDFRRLPLLFPPAAEQKRLADHLDRITAKLDTLAAEARNNIALLRERRASLISAAVTGRIDVRAAASRDLEVAA